MEPDLDIALVVERHVCEDGDDRAEHVWVASVAVHHEHVQQDVNQVQVTHLNQHVEVIRGTSHCRQGLEAPEDALSY